jgi:beta-glucosidase
MKDSNSTGAILVANEHPDLEARIDALLERMTLREKIGQMQQVDAGGPDAVSRLRSDIVGHGVGAVINQTDPEIVNGLQRLAVDQTRLGIPLLVGRDVIHGFETVFPIPLGQAASWNTDLVRQASEHAAREARASGINWTFAPMIDISRDARWGRIAESCGEDPFLTSVFGRAMIEGLQGGTEVSSGSLAACAKHYCGYGASEAGRDYNTTNIPENELRNIYLPPFEAAVKAGVATFMSSFGDIDGIPATANSFLLKDVLRTQWGFDGLLVSDWNAIRELCVHGLCAGDIDAAYLAASAGVDMEMAGGAYRSSLEQLVDCGQISMAALDEMVANILRLKFRLGLFEQPYVRAERPASKMTEAALSCARELARESLVLLQNRSGLLPLSSLQVHSVALIGPLADEPREQLGTWVFDGDEGRSVTPRAALQHRPGLQVRFARGLANSRSRQGDLFDAAEQALLESDVGIVCLGEEAILSGEAHCRASIDLPGAQVALLERLHRTGKPIVAVIMAGRPIALGPILNLADAVIFAWHPGSMAGPALCDVLFGDFGPSGRLPVTFPKSSGQIPIYYNHKRTGRPPIAEEIVLIDDIAVGAKQTSLGMTAFHLDEGFEPLFPFGFGLGYGQIAYTAPELSAPSFRSGQSLSVSTTVTNHGSRAMTETIQLYLCDAVASLTRPVRELKAFERVCLAPGESRRVRFEIDEAMVSFWRRDKTFGAETGQFSVWLAPDARQGQAAQFSFVVVPDGH